MSSSARLLPSVFVTAGLSYDTNETALKDAFSQYGDVIAGRQAFCFCVGVQINSNRSFSHDD